MDDIIIKDASVDDAQALLDIYAPYVKNTAITFEDDVPSIEEFCRRIEHTIQNYPYLTAYKDGKLVGYAYAGKFVGREAYSHSAELSIYIASEMRSMGIGRKLYSSLEHILSENGILNLYACIGYPDPEDEYLTLASVKFHERMGFYKVGHFHKCGYKFGRWYDMIWMEKIIGVHIPTMKSLDK